MTRQKNTKRPSTSDPINDTPLGKQRRIRNRFGWTAYVQAMRKKGKSDPVSDYHFWKSLIFLAEFGKKKDALEQVKSQFGYDIPPELAPPVRSHLERRLLFGMFYASDSGGGSVSCRILAIYSRKLGCGVCLYEGDTNGSIELVDAFDIQGRQSVPSSVVQKAVKFMANRPKLPYALTNYAASYCNCEYILNVFSRGTWRDRWPEAKWPDYVDRFKRGYKEIPSTSDSDPDTLSGKRDRIDNRLRWITYARNKTLPSVLVRVGDYHFWKSLILLAEFNKEKDPLEQIKSQFGGSYDIPPELAPVLRSHLKHRLLFDMTYNSDFAGGTSSCHILAIYSRKLGFGVCLYEDYENGEIELIDVFDIQGRRLVPTPVMQEAVKFMANRFMLPSELTNYAASYYNCEGILNVLFQGKNWRNLMAEEEWPNYVSGFKSKYKESAPPEYIF